MTKGSSVLRVNDSRPHGEVHDEFLSLSEAIRLANGTLKLDSLSEAEQKQVSGTPGAQAADRIVVELPGRLQGISCADPQTPGRALFPALLENHRDELDGNGVILDGSCLTRDGATSAFLVSSNYVEVKGFEFRRFPKAGVLVTPSSPGAPTSLLGRAVSLLGEPSEVSGVEIVGNVFRENTTAGVAVVGGNPGSSGRISGMVISRNRFSNQGFAAIVVVGNAAQATEHHLAGGHVQDMVIRGNYFKNEREGALVLSGVTGPSGTVRGAKVRRLLIEENVFENVLDVSVGIIGGSTRGGSVRNAAAEHIVIRRNSVINANGTPFFVTAGWVTENGDPQGNQVSDIQIIENLFRGGKSSIAIQLVGCALERSVDSVCRDNVVSNTEIRANVIHRAAKVGVGLFGAYAFLGGGKAEKNFVRNVTISGNVVQGNRDLEKTSGIEVIGGLGSQRDGVSPNGPSGDNRGEISALVRRNGVEGVEVLGNEITEKEVALGFFGGIAWSAPNRVDGNVVGRAVIGRNIHHDNEYDCLAHNDVNGRNQESALNNQVPQNLCPESRS